MRRISLRVLFLAASMGLVAACSGHVGQIERTESGRVVERIYNDMGGHLATQLATWRERRKRHDIDHYVLDGNCASSCSFIVFTTPKTCYTKSVRLAVHPVSIGGVYETEATRAWTDGLIAYWPKGLQDWWAANRPSVLGRDLLYADLKKIIPERECPEEYARR